jgi:hypothetical protein
MARFWDMSRGYTQGLLCAIQYEIELPAMQSRVLKIMSSSNATAEEIPLVSTDSHVLQ